MKSNNYAVFTLCAFNCAIKLCVQMAIAPHDHKSVVCSAMHTTGLRANDVYICANVRTNPMGA